MVKAYNCDEINDFIIKIRLIKLIKKYNDAIEVNKDFNINSLDLSYSGELALNEINNLFPEINIDQFEIITEEIAKKLKITLTYTDEDLAEDCVETPAYISKIKSIYIDKFLKSFNGKINEIEYSYNLIKGVYTFTELFISDTKEYWLLFNETIEIDAFIEILNLILDFHLYCKRNVIKNGKGLQL